MAVKLLFYHLIGHFAAARQLPGSKDKHPKVSNIDQTNLPAKLILTIFDLLHLVVQASACGGLQPAILGVAKIAERSSRFSYAKLAFANLYTRRIAVRSDGGPVDPKIQTITVIQFCRPGNEKLNRCSAGQKLSGLEQNTATRHIYQSPDAGAHQRIGEDHPVFNSHINRIPPI